MTVNEVLDRAREAGVRIEPHGDRLRLRAPEKPPDELLDLLREHKPAIIEYLSHGIGCARPPESHRRCSGCGGGLQPGDADGALSFTCLWPGAPERIQ